MPKSEKLTRIMFIGETPETTSDSNWPEISKRIQRIVNGTLKNHPEGIEIVTGIAPGAELTSAFAATHITDKNPNVSLLTWQANKDEKQELCKGREDVFTERNADIAISKAKKHYVLNCEDHLLPIVQLAKSSDAIIAIGNPKQIQNAMISPTNKGETILDSVGYAINAATNKGVAIAIIDAENPTADLTHISRSTKPLETPITINNVPKDIRLDYGTEKMPIEALSFIDNKTGDINIAYLDPASVQEQDNDTLSITIKNPNVRIDVLDKKGTTIKDGPKYLSAEDFTTKIEAIIEKQNTKEKENEIEIIETNTEPENKIEIIETNDIKPKTNNPKTPKWNNNCKITLIPNKLTINDETDLFGSNLTIESESGEKIQLGTSEPDKVQNLNPWEICVPASTDREPLKFLTDCNMIKPKEIQGTDVIFLINLEKIQENMEQNNQPNTVQELINTARNIEKPEETSEKTTKQVETTVSTTLQEKQNENEQYE